VCYYDTKTGELDTSAGMWWACDVYQASVAGCGSTFAPGSTNTYFKKRGNDRVLSEAEKKIRDLQFKHK
jgi:hypothetical protein